MSAACGSSLSFSSAARLPLLHRAPEDELYRTRSERVRAGQFLAAARALATRLPEAPYVVNLCRNRLYVAVGFAAALLRGQVSILAGDPTEQGLMALARRYPQAYVLAEAPDPRVALPVHIVSFEPERWQGDDPPPLLAADQLAALVLTSGSTGEPVPHAKNWGSLVARTVTAAERFRFEPAAPAGIVGTVPSQHMYGLESTLLLPWHAPAASFCGAAFYPSDIVAALQTMREPRWLVTTPFQLRALLASGASLAPLAGIISATAPLSADQADTAERRWQTKVFEIFGATEVGAIATRRTTAGEEWQTYSGITLAPEEGGVRVFAEGAPPGRLTDAIALVNPTRFRLLGRREDLIKRAGKRASLAGLTQALMEIEGVEDGVFVAPENLDSEPTARLTAYVVAPTRSVAEIRAALSQKIEPAFLPRRIIKLERLPRNTTGKLPRQELLALSARFGDPSQTADSAR